jgi:hypothetical protein
MIFRGLQDECVFFLVYSSVFSVCFDSLAPARLALRANLRLLYLKGPAFSVVVILLIVCVMR